MHNDFSKEQLDFSSLERLTPRADSWEKVCARLDAEMGESASQKAPVKNNIIPFHLLSAIPLAASIALVALSVLMTAFSHTSESISINSMTTTELASWYNSLGKTTSSDDFETLDNYATLSYLLQEKR